MSSSLLTELGKVHVPVSIILLCIPCVVILLTPPLVCLLYLQWSRKNKHLVSGNVSKSAREGLSPTTDSSGCKSTIQGVEGLQQPEYIKAKKKRTFKKRLGNRGSRKNSNT
jgi:hypothetical protein